MNQKKFQFDIKIFFVYIIVGVIVLTAIYLLMNASFDEQENINTNDTVRTNDLGQACAQIITYAKNPETGVCEQFSTPCDVPSHYVSCGTYQDFDEYSSDVSVNPDDIVVYYAMAHQQEALCTSVYPVKIPVQKRYATIEVDTLVALLNPMNSDAIQQGFYSAIPQGTRLINLRISQGKATANFSEQFLHETNNCSRELMYAQIRQTLMQFPSIQDVEIQVMSKDELIQN